MKDVRDLMATLERDHFYGSLEIKFEAGRIVLLRKSGTLKPIDCRDDRGGYDGIVR